MGVGRLEQMTADTTQATAGMLLATCQEAAAVADAYSMMLQPAASPPGTPLCCYLKSNSVMRLATATVETSSDAIAFQIA
jgi:hypothetical protein